MVEVLCVWLRYCVCIVCTHFKLHVATSIYVFIPLCLCSSPDTVTVPGRDEEDRQLMMAYCTLPDVRPALTLGHLEEWEESEKKRSKQLSTSMEGMSPLRGLTNGRCVCVCVCVCVCMYVCVCVCMCVCMCVYMLCVYVCVCTCCVYVCVHVCVYMLCVCVYMLCVHVVCTCCV